MLLQAWLADTLQQVVRKAPAAAIAAQSAVTTGADANATSDTGQGPGPADSSTAKDMAGDSSSAFAEPGAVGEAGSEGRYAAEVADAAQYVLGVAMEELRRQVSAECKVGSPGEREEAVTLTPARTGW